MAVHHGDREDEQSNGGSRTASTRPAFVMLLVSLSVVLSLLVPIGEISPLGAETTIPLSDETIEAQDYAKLIERDRATVEKRIAELNEEIEAARESVRVAEKLRDDAEAAVEAANRDVAKALDDVEAARIQVREYAVEAYIQPPQSVNLWVLSMGDAEEATFAREVLQIVADDRAIVVDELVAAKAVAEQAERLALENVDIATQAAQAAQDEATSLEKRLAEQGDLARDLDDRLDAALAEAEALAELDAELARELREAELALRERGPSTPPIEVADLTAIAAETPPVQRTTTTTTTTPRQTTTTRPSSGSTSPTTTRPPATTTTRPPATTTTVPTGVATWADMRNVQGIWVHHSIATNLNNMLNAARAAGHNLGGSGFRDTQRQIELRRAHCGPTNYDIWDKPSSQCSPPTARPGRSMHEKGLAVDLTVGGFTIKTRSHAAFIWLAANASKYGFYNLPSEPWHWSTNGN